MPRTPNTRFPKKKSGVPGPRTPVSRFPEKFWSTRAPDSRLQIFRKILEYPGPGLQTPGFQKKSGVPGPRTPDSRFPEKVWSTGAQTPDFQKKTGVPGPRTPDSRFPEKIWSTGAPDSRLQISRKNLEYPRPQTPDYRLQNLESRSRYSRFFLEIWSLESGGTPDWSLESGGTPDFFWKSGVWSPAPRYSRFFLEIWSLESGILQIFSGNLSLESPPLPKPPSRGQMCGSWGGGGEHIYIYIYMYIGGELYHVFDEVLYRDSIGPILGPFQSYLGAISVLSWGHFSLILGPFQPYLGVISALSWGHFSLILGPFQPYLGGHFNLILGPFQPYLGGHVSCRGRSLFRSLSLRCSTSPYKSPDKPQKPFQNTP